MLLEAKVVWESPSLGEDVLEVAYTAPKDVVRARDLGLSLPLEDEDLVVARVIDGQCTIVVHEVAVGLCRLHLSLVAPERLPSARTRRDPRGLAGFAVAVAFHAAFLVLAWASRSSAAESEQRAFELLMKYSAAAEERARADVELPQNPTTPHETAAAAVKKEEGAAGNPARTDDGGRRRKTLGDNPKERIPGEERTFGMIGLLQGGHHAGSSAFSDEYGQGAMGNIFGATIEDAAGAGGLGLSGDGQGGGGLGAGVPLERIGTGTGQGFGSCHCRLGGKHLARVPILRIDDGFSTSGRLPPEAIQRIVRQNFGRLRMCYQRGLERDPGLEGRVAVKFVIDREGEVSMASVAERSLDDESVAQCVARTFHTMSFPKPEGGIVTVVYPIVFEKM